MQKVVKLFSVGLIILISFTCNNNKEPKKYSVAMPWYKKLVDDKKKTMQLWKAAIDSGDFKAYSQVAFAYLLTYREVDLYYYSLIMANKYHCPYAYFILDTILEHEASTGDMLLLSKDKDTKNLAFYYLFRAKELGLTQAKSEVESRFGRGKNVPNSSYFLKQLMSDGVSK